MEPTPPADTAMQSSVPAIDAETAVLSSALPGAPAPDDMLRWARVLRLGRHLNLADDAFENLQDTMLSALGMDRGPSPPPPPPPPHLPETAPHAQAEKALEQRLRHLIQASAPWTAIKTVLIKLLGQTDSPVMIARCAEVALLHADIQEGEEILQLAYNRSSAIYPLIHLAIRNRLVLQSIRTRHSRLLDKILFHYKNQEFLTPLERLYLFLSLLDGSDTATAYMFFKKNHKALISIAESQAEQVGCTTTGLYLSAGKLALSLGYIGESRDILMQIKEPGSDYETALRLLLDHRFLEHSQTSKGADSSPSYTHQLALAAHSAERLQLFATYLTNTRQLGGFLDKRRPELNDILAHPLPSLGDEPETWAGLSKLLMEHSDLENLLPNLFQIFRDNALHFHPPSFDLALWQGPRLFPCVSAKDRYWRGVGLIHYYVMEGPKAEDRLWEAKSLVEDARKDWHHSHLMMPGHTLVNLPHDWRELHKYAFSYTAKNTHLTEHDRTQMLEQLRVCQNEQTVTIQDIAGYLAQPFCPKTAKTSPAIYTKLLDLVPKQPQLEYQILMRRAALTHLTNSDLNRLWQLGPLCQDPDFNWRCASVVKNRGVLLKQVEYAWNISGEKRSRYPIMIPTRQMALAAIREFSPPAHRLMHALLLIGPKIPELLAILDSESTATRPKSFPTGSSESRIYGALAKIPWLPLPSKKYIYGDGHSNLDHIVPPFAALLPKSPWSLVLKYLYESLGLYAWKWNLKELNDKTALLMTRLANRQGTHKLPGRITKWLKSLTSEQRTAWQDYGALARTVSSDECLEALSVSLCRWTTMILQNHSQALESLVHMRAPVDLIWDQERFILGSVYSEIRTIMTTRSKIMVPSILQGLPTIIAQLEKDRGK